MSLIDETDLRIDVYRSGINTKPYVRITHMPTGLVVGCGDERSELRARAVCLAELETKL